MLGYFRPKLPCLKKEVSLDMADWAGLSRIIVFIILFITNFFSKLAILCRVNRWSRSMDGSANGGLHNVSENREIRRISNYGSQTSMSLVQMPEDQPITTSTTSSDHFYSGKEKLVLKLLCSFSKSTVDSLATPC